MKINLVLIMVMLQLSESFLSHFILSCNISLVVFCPSLGGDLPHPKNLNVELLEEYFR
jgi:hypothetical protein